MNLFKKERLLPDAEVEKMLKAYGYKIIEKKNDYLWMSYDSKGTFISFNKVNTPKKLEKFLRSEGLGYKIPKK